MRVLIAEDDRTSRDLLAAVLEKQGHEVVVTRDGAEAWAALEADEAPRLAVLDWLMPVMDGLEVLLRLRERERRGDDVRPTHVIMLTGLGDTEHVARGLDAGADGYVAKPFDPLELRARIDVGVRLLASDDALRDALAQVQTLHGLIPICMHCKRVREDTDYWRRLEDYVSARTGAQFSHSLCPECMEKHYPAYADDEPSGRPGGEGEEGQP